MARRQYESLAAGARTGLSVKTPLARSCRRKLTGYRLGSRGVRVDAVEVDALAAPIAVGEAS